MPLLPTLEPDLEVSRNLRRHLVTFPQILEPSVFNTLAEAVEAIRARGFTCFEILTEGQSFLVTQNHVTRLTDPDPQDRR